MSQITRILSDMQRGDARAVEQLLPLVYQELRQLAAAKMAREKPGQTFQPTELVHEAYLRLLAPDQKVAFENRGHFFGAAAESMRRILVENARRQAAQKRGGNHRRQTFDPERLMSPPGAPADDLIALDDALSKLAAEDPAKAELVKLRYFAGLRLSEAAELLQISHNTADRWWAYAKAFLLHELSSDT